MRRRRVLLSVLFGAAALASLVQIGRNARHVEQGLASMSKAWAAPASPRGARPKVALESLACFECHNFKRFEEGTKFSHTQHDVAGHCHQCHTLEGHFRIGIRKSTCAGCHEEEADPE